MLNRLNIKVLTIIFVVLAIGYAAMEIFGGSQTGNLPSKVLSFTPEEVSKVVINPAGKEHEDLTIKKEGNQWMVSRTGNDDESYKADSTRVKQLLKTFNTLSPMRLATQSEERWEEFEVTDSAAAKLSLYRGDEEFARLLIGRFTYTKPSSNPRMNQQRIRRRRNRGTMTSFVRNETENEVYAVKGFLKSMVNQGINGFRDKSFLKLGAEFIPNKVTFNYPADSSFVLSKKDNQWYVDETPADSASVASYLNKINDVDVKGFAKKAPQNVTHQLQIETEEGDRINLKAKMDENKAVLVCDQYPENIALDTGKSLFERLFKSKQEFLKN